MNPDSLPWKEAEAVDALHDAIMNLPCDTSHMKGEDFRAGYRFGHRDARHAAAELVAASAAPQGAQPVQEPTSLERLNKNADLLETESPLERLRYFCSLAMNGQDWLDVEPFFDAIAAASPADAAPVPQEVERDAQRYRWLKQGMQKDGDDYEAFLSTRGLFADEWPGNLDAAIDAAMNAGLTIPATLEAKNV